MRALNVVRRGVPAVAGVEDRHRAGRRPGGRAGAPVGFLGAAAFQWINPKSWLVCAGAAGTFLDAGAGARSPRPRPSEPLTLASLPCVLRVAGLRRRPQRLLRSDRARRAFNVAMGMVLAGSVAMILR